MKSPVVSTKEPPVAGEGEEEGEGEAGQEDPMDEDSAAHPMAVPLVPSTKEEEEDTTVCPLTHEFVFMKLLLCYAMCNTKMVQNFFWTPTVL